MSIHVNRTPRSSSPTSRAFFCGPSVPAIRERVARIIARIMALPEDRVGPLLDEVSAEFSERHQQIHNLFLERFEQVRELDADGCRSCPNKDDC